MVRKLVMLMCAALMVLPGTAWAVWGGQPDGEDHPNVGAIYADRDGDGVIEWFERRCSGSYAGPAHDGRDAFLTAGHCVRGNVPAAEMQVSFDTDASDGVDGLIQVLEFHRMPGFGHDGGDFRDLGVILLPAGSVDAPPVQIAPLGYLDDLKAAGELKFRIVDIVGYGAEPVWDEPGRTTFEYDGVRKAGTSKIMGLTKAVINYQQNADGNGTGSGLCRGDSGSPQFDQGTFIVLSVTSGGDINCRAYNANYRVDTQHARDFLDDFLTLP